MFKGETGPAGGVRRHWHASGRRAYRKAGLRRVFQKYTIPNLTPPNYMLRNSLIFLIIALVAAWLGFATLAGTAALIAKICFVIFLVIFVISLIRGNGPKAL